jgi:serine/threonine protein kinase
MLVDGRHRIVDVLAQGGMSDVFHGYDCRTERDTAVKVPRLPAGIDPAVFPDICRRFVDEVADARRFCRLVSPVVFLDAGTLTGPDTAVPYLVTGLVHGPTLEADLDDRDRHGLDPRTPQEALELLRFFMADLEVLHATGVALVDAKPANLLLPVRPTRRLRVRWCDFGSMTPLYQPRRHLAFVTSSGGYTAPEVLNTAAGLAPATDVHALAKVFMAVLTHRDPEVFDEVLEYRPPPWVDRAHRAARYRAIREVRAAGAHRDPLKRIPDVATFRRELRKAIASLPTVPIVQVHSNVPTLPMPTALPVAPDRDDLLDGSAALPEEDNDVVWSRAQPRRRTPNRVWATVVAGVAAVAVVTATLAGTAALPYTGPTTGSAQTRPPHSSAGVSLWAEVQEARIRAEAAQTESPLPDESRPPVRGARPIFPGHATRHPRHAMH